MGMRLLRKIEEWFFFTIYMQTRWPLGLDSWGLGLDPGVLSYNLYFVFSDFLLSHRKIKKKIFRACHVALGNLVS